jgi:hypothetical protein
VLEVLEVLEASSEGPSESCCVEHLKQLIQGTCERGPDWSYSKRPSHHVLLLHTSEAGSGGILGGLVICIESQADPGYPALSLLTSLSLSYYLRSRGGVRRSQHEESRLDGPYWQLLHAPFRPSRRLGLVRDGLISKTLLPDRVSVFSVSGEQQSVATPQAARGWAHQPCTHLKIQSCCRLGLFSRRFPYPTIYEERGPRRRRSRTSAIGESSYITYLRTNAQDQVVESSVKTVRN